MPTAVDNASDTIQPSSSSPHTIYRQDVINCSFSSWYKEFRNVTFRSKIYALPPTFIDYLNADNIYLPDDGYVLYRYQQERSDWSFCKGNHEPQTKTLQSFLTKTTRTTKEISTKYEWFSYSIYTDMLRIIIRNQTFQKLSNLSGILSGNSVGPLYQSWTGARPRQVGQKSRDARE